jgi:hypothetical protein
MAAMSFIPFRGRLAEPLDDEDPNRGPALDNVRVVTVREQN